MTLDEFKALVLEADPTATMFKGSKTGSYTVWRPGGIANQINSDDEADEVVRYAYIDRFTKSEPDTVAVLIHSILTAAMVPYQPEIIYEQDTGYIHHSFTCLVG